MADPARPDRTSFFEVVMALVAYGFAIWGENVAAAIVFAAMLWGAWQKENRRG